MIKNVIQTYSASTFHAPYSNIDIVLFVFNLIYYICTKQVTMGHGMALKDIGQIYLPLNKNLTEP